MNILKYLKNNKIFYHLKILFLFLFIMNKLPKELWTLIFLNCNFIDLLSLQYVCTEFKDILQSKYFSFRFGDIELYKDFNTCNFINLNIGDIIIIFGYNLTDDLPLKIIDKQIYYDNNSSNYLMLYVNKLFSNDEYYVQLDLDSDINILKMNNKLK